VNPVWNYAADFPIEEASGLDIKIEVRIFLFVISITMQYVLHEYSIYRMKHDLPEFTNFYFFRKFNLF
jgi:hypothetical protein